MSPTRAVAVDEATRLAVTALAARLDGSDQDTLHEGCAALLARVRTEHETLCVLRYPDDVDSDAQRQWADALRRADRMCRPDAILLIDDRTADLVRWTEQFTGWPATTVLAEAVTQSSVL